MLWHITNRADLRPYDPNNKPKAIDNLDYIMPRATAVIGYFTSQDGVITINHSTGNIYNRDIGMTFNRNLDYVNPGGTVIR